MDEKEVLYFSFNNGPYECYGRKTKTVEERVFSGREGIREFNFLFVFFLINVVSDRRRLLLCGRFRTEYVEFMSMCNFVPVLYLIVPVHTSSVWCYP